MLAVVVVQIATRCDGEARRCRRASEAHAWNAAFAHCAADYASSGDPARALDAARAAYYLQRVDDTLRLAPAALIGAGAADAHQLIGSAELWNDHHGPAIVHLVAAIALHAAAGELAALSRDLHQLSGVAWDRGDYETALAVADGVRDTAERAHDRRMIAFFEHAHAEILRRIGAFHDAERATERALAAAEDEPADQALALLARGHLYLDQGSFALAREPLIRVLALEQASAQPRGYVLQSAYLDLAFVERKTGAPARALVEMQRALLAGTDAATYHLNRGLVFAEMGWLAQADADLAVAESGPLDGTRAWWAPYQRAQVAARRGDVDAAIAADRRAIAAVADEAERSGLFGATVIANHRGPHLHLIGLIAARGQWRDVLDVVAAIDGQALLPSYAAAGEVAPSAPEAPPRRSVATPVHGSAQLVLDAWRGRRLIIAVPGGDRIWRLEVRDGEVSGRDVGAAVALFDQARTLERDPDDAATGQALGAALLPADTDGTVALLAVGPLGRAPLAALRIRAGAIVRVPGVLPRVARAVGHGAPVVLGDPTGDLPAAAGEARALAARLHGVLRLGREATAAALRVDTALLHIAGHTVQRLDGAALQLADGPLAADAIAQLAIAPRVVVLASCGAAVGRDDAGNGSLSAAFLDAGAELVVATRWSVDDAEAARLVRAFYDAGGDRDPIAALAAVQRDRTLSPATRAAFEVAVARPVLSAAAAAR